MTSGQTTSYFPAQDSHSRLQDIADKIRLVSPQTKWQIKNTTIFFSGKFLGSTQLKDATKHENWVIIMQVGWIVFFSSLSNKIQFVRFSNFSGFPTFSRCSMSSGNGSVNAIKVLPETGILFPQTKQEEQENGRLSASRPVFELREGMITAGHEEWGGRNHDYGTSWGDNCLGWQWRGRRRLVTQTGSSASPAEEAQSRDSSWKLKGTDYLQQKIWGSHKCAYLVSFAHIGAAKWTSVPLPLTINGLNAAFVRRGRQEAS